MYAGRIIEQAPTRELFSNMRMPYTRALMDSIPRLENRPHTTLNSIDGQPPDLINPPGGCCFAPRCARVRKQFTETKPPLMSDSRKDHLFACWYPVGGPCFMKENLLSVKDLTVGFNAGRDTSLSPFFSLPGIPTPDGF